MCAAGRGRRLETCGESDEAEAGEGETADPAVPIPVLRPTDGTAPAHAVQATAQDLGALTDHASGRTRASVPASKIAWFKVKVLDEGLDGNPSVKVDVNDPTLEIAIFFSCGTGTNASTCSTETALPANGAMLGCSGTSTLQLDAFLTRRSYNQERGSIIEAPP